MAESVSAKSNRPIIVPKLLIGPSRVGYLSFHENPSLSILLPILVLHGDDDQVVPLEASAARSAELLPQGKLRYTRADLMQFTTSTLNRLIMTFWSGLQSDWNCAKVAL